MGVMLLLLLLMLSRFSPVQLCATPYLAAHQAPPSLGFSRQKHWSGCHFLLQFMKGKRESDTTLSDPMDCSLLDSSVHGIFQARVLEWVASAFSPLAVHKCYDQVKVTQSCPTLWDPMDDTVHGILQARILE